MDGTLRGGRWTRSGRGSCKIWNLHFGDLIRAQVTRGIDHPPTWSASLNATELGKHPTRDAATFADETATGDYSMSALGVGTCTVAVSLSRHQA